MTRPAGPIQSRKGSPRGTAAAQGVAAVILMLSVSGISPAVSAAMPVCAEQAATILGTPGNDTIDGTDGDDVIVGLAGDDLIRGRGGSDIICGGAGNDVVRGSSAGGDIYGNGGNDTLYSRGMAGLTGGRGDDTLSAATDGSEDLVPGPGDDLVIGSATQGDEVQYGFDATRPIHANLITGIATGQGTDTLVDVDAVIGGLYDDILIGNDGNNGLIGREGNDTLIGNGGDDSFSGQQGDDTYEGGPGIDVAAYYDQNFAVGLPWGPLFVNLRTGIDTGDGTDTLTSIEGATGSGEADTMIGDGRDNTFYQLYGGNDVVRAGGGNDIVAPGAGANVLSGGTGSDLVYYRGGQDPDHLHSAVTVDLGAGTSSAGDLLTDFEDVFGSIESDTLIGDGGPNKLYGYGGDDVLKGRAGDDRLVGRRGADAAHGGGGRDRCRAETQLSCELSSAAAARADGVWANGSPWLTILSDLHSTFGYPIG
jgi:Ca2+-binding RTX toxin-like protein